MAQTTGNYQEDAREAKEVAFTRLKAYLIRNSTQGWAHTGGAPAYRQVDADGCIKGVDFTPDELSNAVGSYDALKTLLEGGTPSTGNHWGNVEKLADA